MATPRTTDPFTDLIPAMHDLVEAVIGDAFEWYFDRWMEALAWAVSTASLRAFVRLGFTGWLTREFGQRIPTIEGLIDRLFTTGGRRILELGLHEAFRRVEIPAGVSTRVLTQRRAITSVVEFLGRAGVDVIQNPTPLSLALYFRLGNLKALRRLTQAKTPLAIERIGRAWGVGKLIATLVNVSSAMLVIGGWFAIAGLGHKLVQEIAEDPDKLFPPLSQSAPRRTEAEVIRRRVGGVKP